MSTRRIFATAFLLAAAASSMALGAEKTKRVLVIGIDGCRPDALEAAETPHLDALAASGVRAIGTDILAPRETPGDTVSGPGWSNLLTGVWPDKHGAVDNDFKDTHYDQYPHFFARLKEARPDAYTVSYCSWRPIDEKIVSAADRREAFEDSKNDPDHVVGDRTVKEKFVATLAETDPHASVIYFGQVDMAGHRHGFHPAVPEYRRAIENVDAHVGDVVAAVKKRRAYADEDWLVIVCTDHGGRGKNHGGGRQSPEVRNVFLIVSGDSAERGVIETPTYQVDVPATALAHLGVELKPEWKLDGRPVGLKK